MPAPTSACSDAISFKHKGVAKKQQSIIEFIIVCFRAVAVCGILALQVDASSPHKHECLNSLQFFWQTICVVQAACGTLTFQVAASRRDGVHCNFSSRRLVLLQHVECCFFLSCGKQPGQNMSA